jgi:FkbM family methyltransferase
MEDRLRNLRRAGFIPGKIIDAGAYQGQWARSVREIFPEAAMLLVEPQACCRTALEGLAQKDPRVAVRQTLLGRNKGEARFVHEESNSRVVQDGECPAGESRVEVLPVARLEDVAREAGFEDADFIKLDLQGHELEALAGAGELFGRCEVFMVEVSWIRIGNVPLMHDVIDAFVRKGYRPYDVIGHNYRPLDRALWQSDFIFVRNDSALLSHREWN